MSIRLFSEITEIEHPLRMFNFPGGEVGLQIMNHVTPNIPGLVPASGPYIIEAIITNSNEVMLLVMLVDALKRSGVKRESILIDMPYVPYGRQDRVCNVGESFSLGAFCDIINGLDVYSITVMDPHSDVTPALLNNCKVITSAELLKNYIETRPHCPLFSYSLVSPDAGANKKVFAVSKALGGSQRVIRADKVRDTVTGNIVDTVVYSEDLGDQNVLIVDDICDGGRTFLELGKKLREKTTGKIGLYVTHGIFSKGTSALEGAIDEIYYHICFDNARLDSKTITHTKV